MRRLAITALLPLLTAPALAQDKASEEAFWTPDAAMIARLEAGLKMPSFPNQTQYALAQYDRYYYGTTIKGRRGIVGRFIVPPNREDNPSTGVHITDEEFMPRLRGGGCANVYVTYAPDLDLSSAQCEILPANAPQSQQPHWKPDEQTAAQMEAAIAERMRRAGLPELRTYHRFYSGVTIEGNPAINGLIFHYPGAEATFGAPAMHLSSERENVAMSDGGCRNIMVTYDVKAAKFRALSCDGQGGSGVLSPQD